MQQFASCPKDPDTHWTQHLVAGESQEVATERTHVNGNMRRRLGGIDQCQRSRLPRTRADLRRGIDIAGNIRDVAESEDARPVAELAIQVLERDAPLVINVD